jgi:hypothetical protein
MEEDGLTPEEAELLSRVQARKKVILAEHRRKKSVGNNQSRLPRRADADRSSTVTNMKVGMGMSPLARHRFGEGVSMLGVRVACRVGELQCLCLL